MGSLKEPQFEGNFLAGNIEYKEYQLKKLAIEGKGKGISFQNLAFSFTMQASSFSLNEQNVIDSLSLEAVKKGPRIDWFVQGVPLESQVVRARGELQIPQPGHIIAYVNELTFPLEKIVWNNKRPLHLELDPAAGFKIYSLEIGSDEGGTFSLQGEIEWAGKQKMELLISGLPLQTIVKWTGKTAPFYGTLAGKVLLTGTRSSPEIEGLVKIEKAKWAEFPFDLFSHSFIYREKNLTLTSSLIQGEKEFFHLSGRLPMDLSLVPVKNRWLYPGLAIEIKTTELDLEFLPAIAPFIAQIKGSLSGMGEISGSLAEPKFEGDMEFINTSFQIKPLLQTFHIRQARIKGNNEGITLDEMNLEGESGLGKISGLVELSKFSIARIKARLKMEKWKILYSKGTYFTFNGELSAQGTPPHISVSGAILVPEGKINLPDFLFGKKEYPEILIVKQKGDEEKAVEKKPSFFSKNISAALQLKIPAEFMGQLRSG